MKNTLFVSDYSLEAVCSELENHISTSESIEELKEENESIFSLEDLSKLKYFKITVEEVTL